MDRRPERVDQFDRLPDDLLLLILNRVRDARSLTRCLAVSKRVGLVVPLVDSVFLPIPRKSAAPPCPRPSRGFPLNVLARTVRFLRRVILPKMDADCCGDDESYHDPDAILRPFRAVRSLDVDIPSCARDIGMKNGDGFLLKWVADFGAGLNSCAILGADSLYRKQGSGAVSAETAAEPVLTEKDLKQRIVWIISCLIAAASRHALMKELIGKNPSIEDVQMTDSGKQGKLWMGKEQVAEVRSSAAAAAEDSGPELKSAERSVVPNLKMKLWYVPEMELPETGYVMKGATLIAIRPAKGKDDCLLDDGEGILGDWFGEEEGGGGDERGKAFGEAEREMRKMKVKRSFTMEMNSF